MNRESPRFGLSGIQVLREFTPPELDDEALAPIVKFLRPRTFNAGERILIQGEPGDGMHFIARGEVEVTRQRISGIGPSEHVARLGAGDVFGEMALVTGEPRSATITAVDDVETYELKQEDWIHIQAWHPGLAARIEDTAETRRILNENPA